MEHMRLKSDKHVQYKVSFVTHTTWSEMMDRSWKPLLNLIKEKGQPRETLYLDH